jgi:hypothetical protein
MTLRGKYHSLYATKLKWHQLLTHDCCVNRQMILTKGDYNMFDDKALGIFPPGREYVFREEVVGIVWGHVPYIGWIPFIVQ